MNRGLRRSGRRVAAWRKMNNPCEDYKSISDYGIIGDSRTCALVGIDGSIDWYCIPRFDSPSVFGALLDSRKGGRFKIAPSDRVYHVYQHYAGLTNVLVTEFRCDKGRFKVTDFMPCFKAGRQMAALGEIHRIVTGLEGECKFSVEVSPRPNYGGMTPTA
ncbi:MAG: DUF5911 domain-containing protein, partial [Candidatus Marsarchaeota archaeon]|nr:DUF5911 domain-containing protein [Candidatus Marsarchaeota archaeon]